MGEEIKGLLYADHTFFLWVVRVLEIEDRNSVQLMTAIWTEPKMKIVTSHNNVKQLPGHRVCQLPA